VTPAPFTSPLTAPLFGDPEVAALLSEEAFVARMIAVEVALLAACAKTGLADPASAQGAAERLTATTIAPGDLGAGTARDGVPVPALVAMLRQRLGADGSALHVGATSQDIVDTASVLQWRDLLTLMEARLAALLDALLAASEAHAETMMVARTRSQAATPITLGLRIATWAQPLITLEADLPRVRALLLRVQFGGASGSASAVGEGAEVLTNALAAELGLRPAPSWHLDRSGPLALGGWLVGLTTALAKIARDLIVSGRSEIGEIRAGEGGGSSTMPQKSNPVGAEAIVTLAQYAAALQPLLAQAASPLEERDGAAWALEWLALPQMAMAAGAGLRHALALVGSMQADGDRMRGQLAAGQGAVMAEAATVVLARHLPRVEAALCVKDALARAQGEGVPLAQVLADDPDLGPLEDWPACLSPDRAQPAAESMRRRILATRAPRT
jgi:3-carboxy-cis,cis-muconate cycloisomerase